MFMIIGTIDSSGLHLTFRVHMDQLLPWVVLFVRSTYIPIADNLSHNHKGGAKQ